MIRIAAIFEAAQVKKKFSIEWVAKDGEVVTLNEAAMSSFFSNGKTMNVVNLVNNQVRTVRRNSIISFEGEEAYI